MPKLTTGSLVRLGPFHGRIVDTLTSDTTGERFGRVKFVKHQTGITEVHPLEDFKLTTLETVRWEADLRIASIRQIMEELCITQL